MTRWLGHCPQSKLIWNLFDSHAEETELLVISEGQKESIFCFVFLFLPSFNSEPHNITLNTDECSAHTDLEQSRRKRQQKGSTGVFCFLFSSSFALAAVLSCKMKPTRRLGLKLWIRICTLTDPVIAKRTRRNQTWN